MTEKTTRRGYSRKVVTAGAATLSVPAFVSVASGATDSGYIELETDATIPTDTGISIRIYEDQDGSGSADKEQEESISDGTTVTQYAALDGSEGSGYYYWMEITLTTNVPGDQANGTPALNAATITLPEEKITTQAPEATEPQTAFEVWDNPLAFIGTAVLGTGAIGLSSKSMAVGTWAAYLMFAYLALETGFTNLENVVYATLVLMLVGIGFKLWRLEGGGET